MRGIEGSGHDANVRIAAYRQAVTAAVTSKKVKEAIAAKGAKLVSNAVVLKKPATKDTEKTEN